jgi:hypothetical protein
MGNINEEAEHKLLAAYIHGLRGVVGQQVQFQMPGMMEQAVKLVVTVENAEKHKQMVGGLRKVFASRNRAHITKGRFRGKGRFMIVGVLTFAMGKLVRNAEFNLVDKLTKSCRETQVFTIAFMPCWPAMLSLPRI